MGDGIADEILGQQKSNGVEQINYPSGFGDSVFAGGDLGGDMGGGGGLMSEAEQLEAAIQASLAELNMNGNNENTQ